jgi:hypothetical protein
MTQEQIALISKHGLEDFLETHYHVVAIIEDIHGDIAAKKIGEELDPLECKLLDVMAEHGQGGMWIFAMECTMEFTRRLRDDPDVEEGGFFDILESFVLTQLLNFQEA